MKILRKARKQSKSLSHFIRNTSVAAVAFVHPRNPRKWAFGSNMGFAANAKYLYIYLNEHPEHGITAKWIAANRDEYRLLSRLGLPVVKKWSLEGLRYSLSAGCFLYNSYVTDVNHYTVGRAAKVNLWHGVGIKSIERAIKVGPLYELFHHTPWYKKLYENNIRFFVRPDIFLSTSPMMTAHFSRCFDIDPQKCIESAYPRNKILTAGRAEVMRFIDRYEPEHMKHLAAEMAKFDRMLIYMPTMRDSRSDFLSAMGWDFKAVNDSLREADACLLLKLHPATNIDVDVDKLSNIFIVDPHADVYPLMALSDCLITDYSSVYYDYITMPGKQTWLLIPDYDAFIARERDLAFPYDENTGDYKIRTMAELHECIRNMKSTPRGCTSESRAIIEKFWTHSDHTNADIVAEIASRL